MNESEYKRELASLNSQRMFMSAMQGVHMIANLVFVWLWISGSFNELQASFAIWLNFICLIVNGAVTRGINRSAIELIEAHERDNSKED